MNSTRSADLTIVLIRGPDSREVPLVALAAAAHSPCEQLRRACEFLLDAATHGRTELPTPLPREGDSGGESALHAMHCPKEITLNALHSGEARGDDGICDGDAPALTAADLVSALASPQSLSFFEHLVALHPQPRLRRALERALAVPSERLRATRAAYFVGVLKQFSQPHAESPSPPTSSPTPYA